MGMNVADILRELEGLETSFDGAKVKKLLSVVGPGMPHTPESARAIELLAGLVRRLPDPLARRDGLIALLSRMPQAALFTHLSVAVAAQAVDEADAADERERRITDLVKLAEELPKTDEFISERLRCWRLAMGMPDRPRYTGPDMQRIARELPKANDYLFYRRYTLLGVASVMPREGQFLPLYREALELAVNATAGVTEPYYRKYALTYIAGVIPPAPEFSALYRRTLVESVAAADAIGDPFAREFAYIELIRDVPKSRDYSALLVEVVEKALSFFTVKKWMSDVEVFDVVDYILSAEETTLGESKQNRFEREKYGKYLAREFERMRPEMNDLRLIEVLKPYAHVWIQPKVLREEVKRAIERLESLRETYTGAEIERPVFAREAHEEPIARAAAPRAAEPTECLAIDIGATNTVVMRKRTGEPPEFVKLGAILRQVGPASVVPTLMAREGAVIGAEVADPEPVADIKPRLLDNKPGGKKEMERFIGSLYRHIAGTAPAGGWFQRLSRPTLADVVYMTSPVGFTDYRKSLKEMASRAFKGVKIEFLDEPLAAAIGYQVVEKREKVVMVVDFGGATLNVIIVRVSAGEIHVVAKPDYAQMLGGHDIDLWLAEYLAPKAGVKGAELPHALVSAAERVKIALSSSESAPFELEGARVCDVTREELESILDAHDFYRYVDRAVFYVMRRAEKIGIRKDRIEAVLLTGGSSQIPSFKEKFGDLFPELRKANLIYDHSPLTAVCEGAALYATKEVVDRHLGMCYALRYATSEKERPHSYTIILQKGEPLPLDKSFMIAPAKKLGAQSEMDLELYEVPDHLVARRWAREGGIEFLKQELVSAADAELRPLKTVTLGFKAPVENPVEVTLRVDDSCRLTVKYGLETVDTGLRLQ